MDKSSTTSVDALLNDEIRKKQEDYALQALAREGMAIRESRLFTTVRPTNVSDEGEGRQ